MEEVMMCQICHTGYLSSIDDTKHARQHTEYCRKARLASKYAVSKKEREKFDYFMKRVESYLVEMVDHGEFKFPQEEFHQAAPWFLKFNSIFSLNKIEWLHDMSSDGYITVACKRGGYFYHLTYKGFECLASWLDRDLVCAPIEK